MTSVEPDEVHDVDRDAPLDLTGDALVDEWRGVNVEDVDDVTGGLAGLLRSRSRALLGDLMRPHRRDLVISSILIAVAILGQLAVPWFVQRGIDEGIPPLLDDGDGSIRPLVTAVVAVLVATVTSALSFNAFLLRLGRVGQDIVLDVRSRLYLHFQHMSTSFHERYTSGRVISRQTSDVEAIADLLGHGLINLITSGLMVSGIGVALLVMDWPLALVVLSSFPIIWLMTRWFRNRAEKAYRATREAVALVIVHFVESLGGIHAVHAFRREPRNQQIFEHLDDRYRRANNWSQWLGAIYGPGVQLVGRLTIALALLVGSERVLDGDMTVGILAAFLLYLRRFFAPMEELSQFYNLFQAAAASLEKISGVLAEPPSVAEPVVPIALPRAHGELRFEGVEFGYRERRVLHELDLVIPAGQTIAVVGATGAGKTTVARLAARFWDPVDGRVLLDGVDLRDVAEVDLRRAVITVTQESFLFAGSVADNIRLGRPGSTDAEIEAAARAIGAHAFIEELPDGYATDVHQKGARLSAGQRQLVSFARAFLADPAVLILDEATSSLDVPSERMVQHALRTLLEDRTAIIIAHRLTTVEIADRVIVIDAGRVVEDGAPSDLMHGTGRYAALHQAWLESLV
jgi:ABC-type multidrug transport system fused ATPase/permease subunit